ncbi:MAG: hypothetical protein ACRD07_06190 [Acidimicrobiales bacterium]
MSRLPYQRVDEIAAYLYRAGLYCPACAIEAMIAHRDASPAARDMPVEAVLDQCAEALALDRGDEASFDSSEFPKVVLRIDVADGDRCSSCHLEL